MKFIKHTNPQRGFTLIELLLVVAIIAILTAFAYPGYSAFLEKGRRADAKAVMMEASHYLQRYYSTKNTYKINSSLTLPAHFQRSPATGTQHYTISLVSATDVDYKLEAVGVDDRRCGKLTLDSKGTRGVEVYNGVTGTVSDCW